MEEIQVHSPVGLWCDSHCHHLLTPFMNRKWLHLSWLLFQWVQVTPKPSILTHLDLFRPVFLNHWFRYENLHLRVSDLCCLVLLNHTLVDVPVDMTGLCRTQHSCLDQNNPLEEVAWVWAVRLWWEHDLTLIWPNYKAYSAGLSSLLYPAELCMLGCGWVNLTSASS